MGLDGAKARARCVRCLTNLKQLSLAAIMYADENSNQFPARHLTSNWVTCLTNYYVNRNVLVCPIDPADNRRSYIINGFNDWFAQLLTPEDFTAFLQWLYPEGMNRQFILDPTDTILFGEKHAYSAEVHMDLYQGVGNDITIVDRQKHDRGSNFAFCDGSVRLLKGDGSITPINLWAVTPEWRIEDAP